MDIFLDDLSSSQKTEYVEEEEDEHNSSQLSEHSEPETHPILRALQLINEAGVEFADVIDAVMLGDEGIRAHPRIVSARRQIYAQSVIPGALNQTRRPPQMTVRSKSHKQGKQEIEEWALETTKDILRAELASYAKTTQAKGTESDVVNQESLKDMTIDLVYEEIDTHAPQLYRILSQICLGLRQDRNTQKNPKFCIAMFINALAYQLSQYNNKVQKLVCIYFKAKGVPKSCFNLFQKAGLVMSYDWSNLALNSILEEAMNAAAELLKTELGISIYENIRLLFPIKHQRTDRLSVTDNGTAMTIVRFRDPGRATALLRNTILWKQHREQIATLYHSKTMQQFGPSDIFNLPGFRGARSRATSNIRHFLFTIPQLQKSEKRNHELLKELSPVHQLPHGPNYITKQYMLKSMPIEEATYAGNYAITKEILRQLKVDTDEKLYEFAEKNVMPIVGDQLTVSRLRHLQRGKGEDSNSFDRMEHLIPVSGWMHLDMNLCNAIYFHYHAEESSSGLARDAAYLRHAGLKKPAKKQGCAYHILNEFLQHVTTARMWGLWLWVSGCSSLEDLVEWTKKSTPSDILSAAEKIWSKRASNRALETHRSDPNLCNSIVINRDLLLRHEVWYSTRHGDVGRLEYALPQLLVFFSGAGSSNYTREVAEIIHWRMHEAPPEIGDLIRDECWLLNTRGQADTFYPFDLRQELNNLSIKEHRPPPHGCTWESHHKWAPALPVFTDVVLHMDKHFQDFYCSRKHHVPAVDKDLNRLIKRHNELQIHQYDPNRPAVTTPLATTKKSNI